MKREKSRRPIYLVCQGRGDPRRIATEPPPLGVLYVAASLADAGWRVRLFHLQGRGDRSLERAVLEERPWFVGFSNFVAPSLKEDIRLSAWLHSQKIPVVWGGIFSTTLPRVPLESGIVDYIVMGEGERAVLPLAEAVMAGELPRQIPGVGYRDGEEIVLTPPAPPEPDLDQFRFGLELAPLEKYIQLLQGGRYRYFRLPFSRGCPFRCRFCYNAMNPLRQNWRCHSQEYMREMIRFLQYKHGINLLGLVSDNAFGRPEEAKKNLADLGIEWLSLIHLTSITPELVEWARENGCRRFGLGLESGSDRVLREILGKTFTQDMIREKLALCRQKGMATFSSWMGLIPGESRAELRQTFQRLEEICQADKGHSVTFNLFCLYPRTPLWEEVMGEGGPRTLREWGEYKAQAYPKLEYSRQEAWRLKQLVMLLYPMDRRLDRRLPARLRPFFQKRLFHVRPRAPLEEAAWAAWQAVKGLRRLRKVAGRLIAWKGKE